MSHDFKERLGWSEDERHAEFWDSVYHKAFPNMVNHMPCPGDTLSQRMGIDRLVMLNNGHVLKIDEKTRDKDYGDILLEFISVDTDGSPGWMEKDLAIDYIAYAVLTNDTQYCYMLPWLPLKRAWRQNRAEWKRKAKHKQEGFWLVDADNDTYKTWSVAVPSRVLFSAMDRAARIDI
jgi:hypothetical protein